MRKLICPKCNTPTAFQPEVMRQNAIDIGSSKPNDHTNYVDVWAKLESDNYAIVVCVACEAVFVAKKIGYDEWEGAYPIPHKSISEDVPKDIKSDFEEASLCFAVGAYRATVAMCQITLEALWRHQNATGLNDLGVSQRLLSQAKEIRLWGNIVKHEDFPNTIDREDVEQLLTYLDAIMNEVYIAPARLAALSQKREQRKQDDNTH